jgi:NAD(P) transhydrogenase
MSGSTVQTFDVVVIGSGPAGQKAAIQAAKAGKRVAVVEKGAQVGGECVVHGTIPSKTLREVAVRYRGAARRLAVALPEDLRVHVLTENLGQVVDAHHRLIDAQLLRNGIARVHGRARFTSPHDVEVLDPNGRRTLLRGEAIVIAVGSRPRLPKEVPVDHEHVLDSDSILALGYLPRSLVVLGGGVIACEYASVFAALGVEVTIVDKAPRPLAFLAEELSTGFVAEFEQNPGCRYLGLRKHQAVRWDGVREVVTTLDDGSELRSDKLLCALGREANLQGLAIEAAGLQSSPRGLLDVDAHCRTRVPHIYAVGDVIGPPSLAATAMEQGRRAMRHWLGLDAGAPLDQIPLGIYTIPEMSQVGLTPAQARERHGGAATGHASFGEVARGQIAQIAGGFLTLVAAVGDGRLLGAQILGEGATELIHIAQMALIAGQSTHVFVEHVFNFPTLAEAYRVAALDLARRCAGTGVSAPTA